MKMYRLALIPAVIAASVSPAHAQERPFYVAPMGSYVLADKDRYSDDGFGGALAVGAMLTDTIAFELRGSYLTYRNPQPHTYAGGVLGSTVTTTSKKDNYGGGAGLNLYLTPNGGGPYIHGDIQAGTNTMFNPGLGWDLSFAHGAFAIRAEALYHVVLEKNETVGQNDYKEALFNLGVRIPFGALPKPPPGPPPEPVQVVAAPSPPLPQCSDGIDNDGDGKIDYPADPGCTDANDNDETDPICKAPDPGQAMSLEGCGVGDTIILQGVTFEFDKASLTVDAKVILDGVANALTARGDIKIELGGYTDGRGSDAYNIKLSDRRAASVKSYLESKGVAADRMTSHGYGKAMPIADNATDSGRELNRRVELKVTEATGAVRVAPIQRTAEDAAPLAMSPMEQQSSEGATASPSAGGTGNAVTIKDFAFSPATLTVPVGTTVTWTNQDGSNHFVAFPDQKSDRLKLGATYSRTFTAPGSYPYACTLHPEMKGTVVVQ